MANQNDDKWVNFEHVRATTKVAPPAKEQFQADSGYKTAVVQTEAGPVRFNEQYDGSWVAEALTYEALDRGLEYVRTAK